MSRRLSLLVWWSHLTSGVSLSKRCISECSLLLLTPAVSLVLLITVPAPSQFADLFSCPGVLGPFPCCQQGVRCGEIPPLPYEDQTAAQGDGSAARRGGLRVHTGQWYGGPGGLPYGCPGCWPDCHQRYSLCTVYQLKVLHSFIGAQFIYNSFWYIFPIFCSKKFPTCRKVGRPLQCIPMYTHSLDSTVNTLYLLNHIEATF